MIAFYLAQGAAVFLTGFGLSRLVGSRGWLAKLAWMIFSYALWIGFTYFALFYGVNSFLVFFFVAKTCAVASALFLLAWLTAPWIRTAVMSRGRRPDGPIPTPYT